MKSTPTIRSSLLVLSLFAIGLLAARGDPRAASGRGTVLSTAVEDLPQARRLPPLVFVARIPDRLSGQVPGLGPGGRAARRLGRLMLRESDGRLRTLVSSLADVSDPAVSWDARRIVFAGVDSVGSAWRLYVVNIDGSGLTAVTRSDRVLDLSVLGASAAEMFARYDDFDPCWLPDGRIVFASTRFPQVSQEGRFAVSNLFVVNADGTGLERITSERNGAEEPTIDTTGRIVYARWFFNPYRATEEAAPGWTLDRAAAATADTVDHWQLVSVFPDGDRIELAAGPLGVRTRPGVTQPCVLKDGTLVGVQAERSSLLPYPGGARLVSFGRMFGEVPVATGPQEGFAVSPATLPDGRIVFSYAPKELRFTETNLHGPGLFGLYALSKGKREIVVTLPRTSLLDPAPLVKRKIPPVLPAQGGVDDPAWTLPVTTLDQVRRMDDTFRFDCLNVYLTGPVDSPFPDAPRITKGARIRFFAALARPDAATGDTIVLVREAKLEASGAVHESDIPGDVPLFEQLVDENGRILRSAHGPAHVPGMNFSRIGSGTKCVGCHEGHSALPVPKNNFEAKWFNASPSAVVTVSSGSGASELVDRRAKGTMGWVAEAAEGQWARLTWPLAVEARSIVLYALHLDGRARTDLQVRECQLVFYRDGREVGRATASRVRPEGTRIDFSPVRLDAIEVRPTRVTGRVDGRPAVALAEIETIARMIE